MPFRIAAPMAVFVFGLAITWLSYILSLDLDLDRNLSQVRDRALAEAALLASMCETQAARGNITAAGDLARAMARLPMIETAGIMDASGALIADSSGKFTGYAVDLTPLAEAARIDRNSRGASVHYQEDASKVYAHCSFSMPDRSAGWALVTLDRRSAVQQASADAAEQVKWTIAAIALLSLLLWAVLHFGYAKRLARLASDVKQFGETRRLPESLPQGTDEVGALAGAFSDMTEQIREQTREQQRLERELLEVSERERRLLGHDLHDSLGQRLAAASMQTNALEAGLQQAAHPLTSLAAETGKRIREAIAEARALSRGLAPVTNTPGSLVAALGELASSSTSGAVRCVLEPPAGDPPVSAETGMHLFRIAQEAVSNALKHASPSEIRISIETAGGNVVLEVEDDGAGLPDNHSESSGMGMRLMKYRASLIGGTLEATASPAGGTLIRCVCKANPAPDAQS